MKPCFSILASLLVGTALIVVPPASAQENDKLTREDVLPERSGSAKGEVPDWATGSSSSSRPSVGSITTKAPTNPSNPSRTPIGGLAWLVTAGMGYGIYRFRRVREVD